MCTFGLSKTCTFERPGASNTTKIPREDTQRETKRAKMGAGEGKNAKFWALRPSAPPFKAPDFGAPDFGAPPFGALLFPGLGPPPFGAPPFVVQKFNIQKLAEIEIGRTRKKSWPKSKLAEVDNALPRTQSAGPLKMSLLFPLSHPSLSLFPRSLWVSYR